MTDKEQDDYELMRVTDVEYLHGYVMLLEFNHKEHRIVNFEPLLKGRHFYEELLDPNKFIQFALTMQTLEWYNGVDFSPEYLYANSVPATFDFDHDTPLPTAAEA